MIFVWNKILVIPIKLGCSVYYRTSINKGLWAEAHLLGLMLIGTDFQYSYLMTQFINKIY